MQRAWFRLLKPPCSCLIHQKVGLVHKLEVDGEPVGNASARTHAHIVGRTMRKYNAFSPIYGMDEAINID